MEVKEREVGHVKNTRSRNVEVRWVPGTDIHGRPIMEMRWLVEDGPSVVTTA